MNRSQIRLFICAVVFAWPSYAAIYESPVIINDEDDLFAAEERGAISEATMQTLVELLDDGIDLNTANREDIYELPSLTFTEVDAIIKYRKEFGPIEDPDILVAAGVITADQLVQIAPFLIVSKPSPVAAPKGRKWSGRYRLLSAYTLGDNLAPPAVLVARANSPFFLSGGIGLDFSRRQLSMPYVDLDRTTHCAGENCAPLGEYGTIGVDAAGPRIDVPKFFLQFKYSKFKVVAGTYRLGFGQRVTLDNSSRYNPNTITPDTYFYKVRDLGGTCRTSTGEFDAALCEGGRYITDDFRFRDSFRGLAASAEDLEISTSTKASLYAFGSFQTRRLYQYQIYDRRDCADPRDDNDPLCASPNVYVDINDPLLQKAKLKTSTLPAIWDEALGGGRVRLAWDSIDVGVTGYGAVPFWRLTPEMQLDFQEWARYPFGGAYGAVGADAHAAIGDWNLFLELTRTFDKVPEGGGGWGVVQRSVWGHKKRELEITARLYDIRFVNPYARPVSARDQVDGQRARDEAGLRIKYTDSMLGEFRLRGFIDVSVLPWDQKGIEGALYAPGNDAATVLGGYRAGTTRWESQIRGDYYGWGIVRPALWFEFRDKDVLGTNRTPDRPELGRCYTSVDSRRPPDVDGKTQLCLGELYRFGTQIRFLLIPSKLDLSLTYIHDFLSDYAYAQPAQDIRLTVEVSARPVSGLLVRLRSRYYNGDLNSRERVEESLWSFLQITWMGWKPLHVTGRYDLVSWLDQTSSTLKRTPNPEHRFRLELSGSF